MRHYTAAIHKDEGSAYGLTFPELPGCFAASDTWEGIAAAAKEAVELWFEDHAEVEPIPAETLGRHPDFLKAQGFIMVPFIPADGAVERINITIERGLLRAIDDIAKSRGMTRSSFIASAARHEIVGV